MLHRLPGRRPSRLRVAIKTGSFISSRYRWLYNSSCTAFVTEMVKSYLKSSSKIIFFQELCDITLADGLAAGLYHDQATKQPHLGIIFCMLKDIARGVAFIHSKNIIHGRFQPQPWMSWMSSHSSSSCRPTLNGEVGDLSWPRQ